MSIQSNVNQMISIAGLLLNTNPQVKAAVEKREAAKAFNREKELIKTDYEEYQKYLGDVVTADENLAKVEEGRAAVAELGKKGYKETGDPDFLNEYKKWKGGEYLSERMARKKAMSETAISETEMKQEEKRKTRRNFLDYIASEPTSLGGTVGELDPKLQKAIAKNYSKSERKKIMDRKDETE